MSAPSSLLIQNGRVLDPSQSLDAIRDILIEKGRIAAIEAVGVIPKTRAERALDVKDHWVTPGLIDAHVHLREPGFERKETIATGTQAARAGGFTAVACMANTEPVNDSPWVTAMIREKAKQSAACHVFPIGAVSKGLRGEHLAEIGGMVAEGACAISDDGMPVMNSLLMRRAMDYAKGFNIAIISHAEDAHLAYAGAAHEGQAAYRLGLRSNPSATEEIMVSREISLCRLTGARVHIAHLSTSGSVELIRRAKQEGLPISAEVSPHHLLLCDEDLEDAASRGESLTSLKMAPPLRTRQDREALRTALAEGIIDLFATDHAPHGLIDKDVPFDLAANGILGLQTAVPLTLEWALKEKISPLRWAEAWTSAPARLLNLPLGTLRVGVEADLTILDPAGKWILQEEQILSKSFNTPFLNRPLQGLVKWTILQGQVAQHGNA